MDELEVKLENLDKLFDEAHKLNELDRKNENDNIIKLNNKNKLGTINNLAIKKLNSKDDNIKPIIKEDAKKFVQDMDKKQKEELSDKIADTNPNNKLMEVPNDLLPMIKDDSHALVVQKPKSLALMKKAGIVFPSILVTFVTLAIGAIIAAILLTK